MYNFKLQISFIINNYFKIFYQFRTTIIKTYWLIFILYNAMLFMNFRIFPTML